MLSINKRNFGFKPFNYNATKKIAFKPNKNKSYFKRNNKKNKFANYKNKNLAFDLMSYNLGFVGAPIDEISSIECEKNFTKIDDSIAYYKQMFRDLLAPPEQKSVKKINERDFDQGIANMKKGKILFKSKITKKQFDETIYVLNYFFKKMPSTLQRILPALYSASNFAVEFNDFGTVKQIIDELKINKPKEIKLEGQLCTITPTNVKSNFVVMEYYRKFIDYLIPFLEGLRTTTNIKNINIEKGVLEFIKNLRSYKEKIDKVESLNELFMIDLDNINYNYYVTDYSWRQLLNNYTPIHKLIFILLYINDFRIIIMEVNNLQTSIYEDPLHLFIDLYYATSNTFCPIVLNSIIKNRDQFYQVAL